VIVGTAAKEMRGLAQRLWPASRFATLGCCHCPGFHMGGV